MNLSTSSLFSIKSKTKNWNLIRLTSCFSFQAFSAIYHAQQVFFYTMTFAQPVAHFCSYKKKKKNKDWRIHCFWSERSPWSTLPCTSLHPDKVDFLCLFSSFKVYEHAGNLSEQDASKTAQNKRHTFHIPLPAVWCPETLNKPNKGSPGWTAGAEAEPKHPRPQD